MRKWIKEFIIRGMIGVGIAEVILAVIYEVLWRTDTLEMITAHRIFVEILSVFVMGFLMGGISIVHKIETLSLFAATTIHVISLYAVVTATYMFNGWLLMTARWLTVYMLGFLAAYAIIWIFIYLLIRRRVTKMNRQIQG